MLYDTIKTAMRRRTLLRDNRGKVVNCPDDTEIGDIVVPLSGDRAVCSPTNRKLPKLGLNEIQPYWDA